MYDGPLFLELKVRADFEIDGPEHVQGDNNPPRKPEGIRVTGVGGLFEAADGDACDIYFPTADTASETQEAILRGAFPNFAQTWYGQGHDATEAEVRDALWKDLQTQVTASWKQKTLERRNDPVSAFAQAVDISVDMARRIPSSPPKATSPSTKKKPTKPKPKKPTRRR